MKTRITGRIKWFTILLFAGMTVVSIRLNAQSTPKIAVVKENKNSTKPAVKKIADKKHKAYKVEPVAKQGAFSRTLPSK